MVDKILKGVVPYKPVRFLKVPSDTYAVYFHDKYFRGADELIGIVENSVRIELYSKAPEIEIENKIAKNIIDLNLEFEMGERTWLNSENTYMTVYYIDYTTKGND